MYQWKQWIIYIIVIAIIITAGLIEASGTIETHKWDIKVNDKVIYTCLPYDEYMDIYIKLIDQRPRPDLEAMDLMGIRTWMCDVGLRDRVAPLADFDSDTKDK